MLLGAAWMTWHEQVPSWGHPVSAQQVVPGTADEEHAKLLPGVSMSHEQPPEVVVQAAPGVDPLDEPPLDPPLEDPPLDPPPPPLLQAPAAIATAAATSAPHTRTAFPIALPLGVEATRLSRTRPWSLVRPQPTWTAGFREQRTWR